MTVLTRKEFSEYFNKLGHGLGDSGSILWEADRGYPRCQYFISVKPISMPSSDEYWDWCEKNLKGHVRCFSSNCEIEYWGFTDKNDILWWLLKWS